MKEKIAKIILIISFVPAALILLHGFISIWEGSTFLFSTTYGLEGMCEAILLDLLIFSTIIPILPVCVLYQIGFLIYLLSKKKAKIYVKRYAIVAGCGMAVFALVVLWALFSYEIESFVKKQQAKQMIHQSEEEIFFNYAEKNIGGIFHMEGYEYDCILVDYDRPRVGFLISGGVDEFNKVDLKLDKSKSHENILKEEYYLQALIPLKSGGTLKTYTHRSYDHCTKALILELADGTVYYTDNILNENERGGGYLYTSLNTSEFSMLKD